MSLSESFILSLLIVFALPWAVWRLLGGRVTLPLVVIQITGGILLGPGVSGVVFPGLWPQVFRPEVIAQLNGLALWAVTLFVFLAGLELNLARAWEERRETVTVAGLALLVPLVLGALVSVLLLNGPGWTGASGQPWQRHLGLGMACAVTALPILVLFLDQLGVLRKDLGQRVLRYASLDDLAIWAVLALILLDWSRIGRQAGFILIFLTAAPLMRRLILRLREADRLPVALIWLIASALMADWAGLHFMVGAFLSGAVLDARWFGAERVDRMRETVLTVLMPVFFLSTGLRTAWTLGGVAVIAAAGLLLLAAVGGKLLGVGLAGRMLGWQKGQAWTIGWLLQTKALIMIIFANVLLDRAIISPESFTALLLMAVASTLLTMPIVAPRVR